MISVAPALLTSADSMQKPCTSTVSWKTSTGCATNGHAAASTHRPFLGSDAGAPVQRAVPAAGGSGCFGQPFTPVIGARNAGASQHVASTLIDRARRLGRT